jgi:hypothetical protein
MTRAREYTKLNDAKRRNRGQAEGLSDAKAQSVIRLVTEQHEANRVTAKSKRLARDIVHNFEGEDAYVLDLQARHGSDRAWLPGPSATRIILSIAQSSESETDAA